MIVEARKFRIPTPNKKMLFVSPNRKILETRRECLKSAIYLRLKKHITFFGKKLEIFDFFFQKMSHSAEKCKRGDPLGFINIYSVAKYQKLERGPFGDIKNFIKKSHSAEKNPQGDPLGTSGFVGFLEKLKK